MPCYILSQKNVLLQWGKKKNASENVLARPKPLNKFIVLCSGWHYCCSKTHSHKEAKLTLLLLHWYGRKAKFENMKNKGYILFLVVDCCKVCPNVPFLTLRWINRLCLSLHISVRIGFEANILQILFNISVIVRRLDIWKMRKD